MPKDREAQEAARKEDEKISPSKVDPISITLTTIKWVARVIAEVFR
jgi:hypothetical protein